MAKRIIPIELKDKCIQIYEEVLDKDETDSIAILRIQELFRSQGEEISERTIYRYISEWKKSGQLSSIMETYEVELDRPKYISEQVMERLFERFKKSDLNEKVPQKELIGWADALNKYIDLTVKIEVLRSKKITNVSSTSEQSAKIVTVGSMDEIDLE